MMTQVVLYSWTIEEMECIITGRIIIVYLDIS